MIMNLLLMTIETRDNELESRCVLWPVACSEKVSWISRDIFFEKLSWAWF